MFFYRLLLPAFLSICSVKGNCQSFSLSEKGPFIKEVSESYFYLFQGVKIYLDTTKLSYKNVQLTSNDIEVKKLNDREYSLFNNNPRLDSVKMVLVNRKTKRKLDSLYLKTAFFRFDFITGIHMDGAAPSIDANSFQFLSTGHLNKFINPVKVQSFEIEILDTNWNVHYSQKIFGRDIGKEVLDTVKKSYTDKYFLLRLKNICMLDGVHLLHLPEYILFWPGLFDKDNNYQYEKKYTDYTIQKLRELRFVR